MNNLNSNQNSSQNFKTTDLIKDIDLKNSEIIKLNLKIQDLDKIKNEMIIDLERYEDEFQILEKKFLAKENELMDKLQISFLEKENLENRLEYFTKMYPSSTTENFKRENSFNENKRLKEELIYKNERLEMFLNFYNLLQNLVLKKNTSLNVLQNIDTSAFKFRMNEILEELKKSFHENNNLTNKNICTPPQIELKENLKNSEENKNETNINLKNYENKSSSKNDKDFYTHQENVVVNKIAKFTAPDIDENISVKSIKTNNNIVTDSNKLTSSVRKESNQEDKKLRKIIINEKNFDNSEKLIETVKILSEKIDKIETYISKQSQDKANLNVQKTNPENKSTVSTSQNIQKDNNINKDMRRKPSLKK